MSKIAHLFGMAAAHADAALTTAGEESTSIFVLDATWWIILVIVALAAAGIAVMSMRAKLKTAARNNAAENYVRQGSLRLKIKQDIFMYESVERRKVQSNNNK